MHIPNSSLSPMVRESRVASRSQDLWVASDLCTLGPCAFPKRHRFNRSHSRTFHQVGPGFYSLNSSYKYYIN